MLRLPPWLLARPRGLVAPGSLSAPLTFSRAQVSGVASSATAADGATLALFGADVPRFQGAQRRLLIEPQRTNSVTNPRGEGGTVGGTGSGSMPTGWDVFSANGLTTTFVGRGIENGRNYVDLRFNGTSTGTFYVQVFGNPGASIAAGQVAAGSAWVSLVAGSLANVSGVELSLRWSPGGAVTGQAFTPTATPARISVTDTAPAGATTVFCGFVLVTHGAAIDCTLRFSWPQLEVGAAFASSAILPPVGTPGASTRGADIVTATLASLGVPASGACTVLWSGVMPAISYGYGLLQIDDGTENNRASALNLSGSANMRLSRVTGGAGAGTDIGTHAANTTFQLGMCLDGAGRVSASINGAAAVALTGAPTSGLTTLRLASNSALAGNAFSETLALRVLPYVLSDTDLAAAVAALPT